jgi:HK97 family phage prohead protease
MADNTERKEIRTLKVSELRADKSGDSDAPKLKGYAATFDDETEIFDFWYGEYNEVIRKGAFERAIEEKQDVRALLNHDANYVFGRTTSGTLNLKEDDHGLAVEIDPPDAQWAEDIMVSVERGDIDQMSFGFYIKEEVIHKNDEGEITLREVLDVDLFDVSVVTYPAYPTTEVGLRSLTKDFYQPPTVRDDDPATEHPPVEEDAVTADHPAEALLHLIDIERLRD